MPGVDQVALLRTTLLERMPSLCVLTLIVKTWDENWLNSLNDNPGSDTGDNPDSDTGYVEQATSVGKIMTDLTGISADNYTQATIDQYFS